MQPSRTVVILFAALSLLSAAIFLTTSAIMDAGAIVRAQSSLIQADAELAAFQVAAATKELRVAIETSREVCDGSWLLHTWTRMFRADQVRNLRIQLEAAVIAVSDAVTQRAQRSVALRVMVDEVDRVSTLAALDVIEQRLNSIRPFVTHESPEMVLDIERKVQRQRIAFTQDLRRNEERLQEIRKQRTEAEGNPSKLLAIIDSVFPGPVRGQEDRLLQAIHDEAAASRANILESERIQKALDCARLAASSTEAATCLTTLLADADLARTASPKLADSLRSARVVIDRRVQQFQAWELNIAEIVLALKEGDPASAAHRLARIKPFDDRTRAELKALRATFSQRAVDAFVLGAVTAIDRADWTSLARRRNAFTSGSRLWSMLEPAGREAINRLLPQIDLRIDRGLYEEFVRAPRSELADRYLQGWPVVVRRMAPAVLAWKETSTDLRTAVILLAAKWATTGAAPVTLGIEDRPDAHIEVRLAGETVLRADAVDIRESENSYFQQESRYEWRADPNEPTRIAAEVRIDLRDAILADPIAVGAISLPFTELRASRVIAVAVSDPTWSERAHLLFMRVLLPDATPLPPFIVLTQGASE